MGEFSWKDASPVVSRMVAILIARKLNEAKLKRAMVMLGSLQIAIVVCMLIYFRAIWKGIADSLTFTTVFSQLQEGVPLFLTVLFIACSFLLVYFHRKHEEAEEDYENLREEIVDRCEELFQEKGQWEKRHELFDQLIKEYDINLYHK